MLLHFNFTKVLLLVCLLVCHRKVLSSWRRKDHTSSSTKIGTQETRQRLAHK